MPEQNPLNGGTKKICFFPLFSNEITVRKFNEYLKLFFSCCELKIK